LGEGRVAQAVAGALQADDEAVADELVVARALQLRDVLDAGGGAVRRQLAAGRRELPVGARPLLADRDTRERRRKTGVDKDAVARYRRLHEIGAGCGTSDQRKCQQECGWAAACHEAPTLIEPSAITVPENILPLSTL